MVVDRYFETRSQALAWEKSHPHFMNVQIVTPGKIKALANNSPPPPAVAAPPVSMPVALQPAFPIGDSYFGAFSESSPSTIRSTNRRRGADWSFAEATKSRGPLESLRGLSWVQID